MDIFQELEAALADVKKEAAKLQNEVVALHRERQGEVWYYQGDGEDKLESLTCPVLIEAEDLRALLKVPTQERLLPIIHDDPNIKDELAYFMEDIQRIFEVVRQGEPK